MPPKAWTAWPVELENLPRENLLGNGNYDSDDDDDGFTYRNEAAAAASKMPSSDLQEELSATVLRMAKRRFQRRRGVGSYHEYTQSGRQSQPPVDDASPSSPAPTAGWDTDTDHESKVAATDDASEAQASDTQGGQRRKRARTERAPGTYRAVVSTDDDRSYEILAAPVRHILSQTDRTLGILHTLRANGVSYQSDSSTDGESDSSHGSKKNKAKISRGGCRTAKQVQSQGTGQEVLDDTIEDGQALSDRHRRASSARSEADDAFEDWLRAGDDATSQLASDTDMIQEEEEDDPKDHVPPTSSRRSPRRSMSHRLRLRDWSDVIGAAAIAGFPPAVIARATRRCADLFGEGMVLRRLDEAPAATASVTAARGVHTTEYRPEPIIMSPSVWDEPSSSADEDANDDNHSSTAPSPVLQLHRHIHSRQVSPAASGSSHKPSSRGRRSPSTSASRSRSVSRPLGQQMTTTGSPPSTATPHSPSSRSRSSSRPRSSAGQHFCPVPTCDRSINGFARRANLKRHTELVHGNRGLVDGRQQQQEQQQQQQTAATITMDADSDDEMYGALHVDGFLRTLVPGRGWRGEDVLPRKRDGYRGQKRTGGHESGGPSRGWTEDEGSDY